MKSLGLASFVLAATGAILLTAGGCNSDSTTNNETLDGGGSTSPDGATTTADGATCGKLPPTGPTQVVPPSTDGNTEAGRNAAMTLDSKGRPLVAYVTAIAGGTSTLYVVTWDDCAGAWRLPVSIDTAVPVAGSRSLSLSVDATDNRIAVAYAKTVHLVSPPRQNDTIAAYLATSSDYGLTFTAAKVSTHKAEAADGPEGDINDVDNVRVALGGGKTYVAYNQTLQACGTQGTSGNPPSCRNGTVLATLNGTAYTDQLVQFPNVASVAPNAVTRGFGIGLALDSANNPALAVHLEPDTGYNTELVFWRPGDATATKILDSEGEQNDDGDVSLAFDGIKPRIITRVQPPSSTSDVYFAASNDGKTWPTNVGLPRPEAINGSQNLVVAGGKVFTFLGGPHVFTATDLQTFTAEDVSSIAQGSNSVTGAVDSSGKFYLAFEGATPSNDGKSGVVVYRQP